MAHYAICKYCGIKFDRDKEPWIEVSSKRYAHKACSEKVQAEIPQEEKDYLLLEKYIKELFKTNILSAKIKKQIKDYRQEYGYTYTGILKTLYWWYEIKLHTTELSKDGIGIVPYIYDDAEKYYYMIYMAKVVNSEIKNFKTKKEEIEISSPRVYKNPQKLFNLEREEN